MPDFMVFLIQISRKTKGQIKIKDKRRKIKGNEIMTSKLQNF